MVKSVKTYNVDTTIGGSSAGDVSLAGTLASEGSMDSITAEDWKKREHLRGEERRMKKQR